MRKSPARSWVTPVLATIIAALLSAAGCSGDDNSEEAQPTNDVSAGICAEGAEDCDDTAQDTPHPDQTDSSEATPATETCTDAQACEERSIEIARGDLAAQLSVDVDSIAVVSSEAARWPDACLDAAKPGTVCAQVITPGFKIVLESDGAQYEYHTDEGTRAVLVE